MAHHARMSMDTVDLPLKQEEAKTTMDYHVSKDEHEYCAISSVPVKTVGGNNHDGFSCKEDEHECCVISTSPVVMAAHDNCDAISCWDEHECCGFSPVHFEEPHAKISMNTVEFQLLLLHGQ